jgi:small multidrug resistance family-3 protein
MSPLFYFCGAAFFEIAGCFALWQWLRESQSVWLLPFGVVSLLLFALILTRVDVAFAGRAYAADGGIYVVASLAWLYFVERQLPNKWDLLGVVMCLIGTLIILLGAHGVE